MTANPFSSSIWRARIAHVVQLFAALAVAITLAYFSARNPLSHDVTKAQIHTLSAISLATLEAVEGTIVITAYLPPNDIRRENLKLLIDRYRRHRPGMRFEFVDPATKPERVRSENIKDGEVIIQTDGRQERITIYGEQFVTEALSRLARAGKKLIVFISGHGERSSRRETTHDLSDWTTILERRGFSVQEINLAKLHAVPEEASIVVLASPQVDFQPVEISALISYIDEGGNLLWLTDPTRPTTLDALERKIGLKPIPGTIVDPVSIAHGVNNPAFVLLNRYANHPSLAGFNYTTVMFYAVGINIRVPAGWRATRLILSGNNAWSETGPLDGNVGYDKATDFLGPLPVAAAMSRDLKEHQQRIIVVGDSDFLANVYLHNSGNQDLGVQLVEWLAHDDRMISVPSRVVDDYPLELKDWHKAIIGFGFLFVLPIVFVVNGFFLWWRRRRA